MYWVHRAQFCIFCSLRLIITHRKWNLWPQFSFTISTLLDERHMEHADSSSESEDELISETKKYKWQRPKLQWTLLKFCLKLPQNQTYARKVAEARASMNTRVQHTTKTIFFHFPECYFNRYFPFRASLFYETFWSDASLVSKNEFEV